MSTHLPTHDPNIPKQEQGLYQKFNVSRTDGSDGPGGKHDGCFYFVLDLSHDHHAYRALKVYIESCRREFPALAEDLTSRLIQMRRDGLGAEALESPSAEDVEAFRRYFTTGKLPPAPKWWKRCRDQYSHDVSILEKDGGVEFFCGDCRHGAGKGEIVKARNG